MSGDEPFLSRWSRRKIEARSPERDAAADEVAAAPAPAPVDAHPDAPPAGPAALPPVDSLTTESDFAPFMAPGVDGGVRQQALKTLFSDPRYNVMDMLDVYVDDYSKPDPLPDSWLENLEQVSRLGDRAGRDREEAERKEAERKAVEQEAAQREAALADGGDGGDGGDAPGESRPSGETEAPAVETDTPAGSCRDSPAPGGAPLPGNDAPDVPRENPTVRG
jgi:hypothetical protein